MVTLDFDQRSNQGFFVMPDPLPFTLLAQHKWAEAIGRKVSRHFHFREKGQEQDDLVSVAVEMLCDLYTRTKDGRWNGETGEQEFLSYFKVEKVKAGGSPEGQFRGWAHDWIESECVREAKRLRNAGTYRTTRPENEPAAATNLGDGVDDLEGDLIAEYHAENTPVVRGPGYTTTDDLDKTEDGRRLAKGPRKRH